MSATERTPTTEPGRGRLAVLGSPIAHSKSPEIHAAAYRALGLEWTYERVECERSGLASFLDGLASDWRGFSLTMPLKDEARRLARVLDPVAEESGVVNTLLRLAGTAGWAGFNTDVGGLADALTDAGLDATDTVVLGAGATAVSAVLAARRLGAQRVTVLARREAAARALEERFGATASLEVRGAELAAASRVFDTASLVVSTLPGHAGAEVPLPPAAYRVPLFDVAYDPWPSPLAVRWRDAGGDTHAGIGMLVRQALLQVRIFVGGDPALPVDDEGAVLAAMRAAVPLDAHPGGAGVGE